MTISQEPSEFLFSYGTLQLESVQMAMFGRRVAGTRDILLEFEQSMVEVENQAVVATNGKTHHPIVKFTGRASDVVSGTVFAITVGALQSANKYEVAGYKRTAVTLQSGIRAWVYNDARFAPPDS